MEHIEQIIKDVSIYLRKSRAKGYEEDDATLLKHREILVDFAKKNNFRYTIYPEVVSGDRIIDRPEMIKLLNDVEQDLYDAVLVMDIDRLGRGDEEDSGKIKRIFRNSGTFIITPTKVYNLENEDDETYLEFQTFLARQEFKMIKRRLARGKKIGSRLGNWTNGIPPIPYKYNADIKGLIINEEKLPLYKMIKDMFLNDLLTPLQISWKLNELEIPTIRNGKKWHGKVIQTILTDETHLGRIVSNKTKGSYRKGQKVVYISKEQWIVVENCHPALKTIEEHNKILEILSKRTPKIKKGIRNKCVLSGLVRCGLCNSVLQVHNSSYNKYKVLVCPGYNSIGKKCECVGIKEDILVDKILNEIDNYLDLNYREENIQSINPAIMEKQILELQKDVKKIKEKMKKIYEMYEDGIYTKEEFNERRQVRQDELDKTSNLIKKIQDEINKNNQTDNIHQNINDALYNFKKIWKEELDSEEKNQLLHLLFKNIVYTRLKLSKEQIDLRFIFH